ncbi:MAG: hypothetical protein HY815_19855 [Candidatus Riflebacteria bacterium]|nr:hypothetical protein [Candidatus Riflebacteria bacterium]
MKARLDTIVLGALAALLALGGCGPGQDDEIVIRESPMADFSPTPGEPVITASRSARAPASSAKPVGAPPPSVESSSPHDPRVPFIVSIPHLVLQTGDFQPRVQIELAGTVGGSEEKIVDLASPDGAGAKGRFKALRPGKYLMRVTSAVLPGYPLASKPVEVNGRDPEAVAFGAVTFKIPRERGFETERSIEVSVVEEPSKKPVFKGLLTTIDAPSLVGEAHPRTLLLPFGEYSYSLADLSRDPTIGFVNVPKGAALVLNENRFELTADKPTTVVSLEAIVRVK